MKTRQLLLYGALALLFGFAASTLVVHYSNLPSNFRNASNPREVPFSVYDHRLTSISDAGRQAGLEAGDKLVAMHGVELVNDQVWNAEFAKLRIGQPAAVVVERKATDGSVSRLERVFTPTERVKDLNYYLSGIIGFTYSYFIPTFCVLLGFWVVLVRPSDFLAWLLLFIMLGFSSTAMEGSQSKLIQTYTSTFFSTWALSMLLFGIYFPERLSLDVRFPWIKWLLVVPLCFQLLLSLIGTFERFSGVEILENFPFIAKLFNPIAMPLNMFAIGLFFACIGWKSGSLKNPDARRRLRLMMIGTCVAMAPSFFIIILRIASGRSGSFGDFVPFWFAILALLLMMLFPLTMAYVIVVQRAMDVRVVVRQGLQYAFAQGGIRVLQFLMLLGIGVTVWWTINNYGVNTATQFAFIVGGIALLPLADLAVRRLRVVIDRKFFREAYDAERILTDLSDEVRTMVETKPLLETVAGKISRSLHVPQVSLLLKEDDKFVPAYSLGFDTEPKVALGGESKTMRKLAGNQHIVLYDDMSEITATPTMSLSDREQLSELNTQVLLPVASKDTLSGIISLSPKLSEEPYTASDLRLLRSVATQTGLALENSRLSEAIVKEAAQKERLNTELEIAREVQERLFPQELPQAEGLDLYGACRPALGVGGDYYDFLELPNGKIGIAIGDISGKGVGASLMMASLQASLRGQVIHYEDDLAGLMAQVNGLVYEASTTNRYATFFYAQYDPAERLLSYVNAGHNPPFLLRNNDSVEMLETGGPVVGMLPPMLVEYEQGTVAMASGDMLVGFTDGISEAMNPAEEEWGETALLERLKQVRGNQASEILELCVACADEFANGAKQHDDMTMIVVKVR